MSTTDKSKNLPADITGGPIIQDSVLHRILEIIARHVAETLDDDTRVAKRTAQQRGPQELY